MGDLPQIPDISRMRQITDTTDTTDKRKRDKQSFTVIGYQEFSSPVPVLEWIYNKSSQDTESYSGNISRNVIWCNYLLLCHTYLESYSGNISRNVIWCNYLLLCPTYLESTVEIYPGM